MSHALAAKSMYWEHLGKVPPKRKPLLPTKKWGDDI